MILGCGLIYLLGLVYALLVYYVLPASDQTWQNPALAWILNLPSVIMGCICVWELLASIPVPEKFQRLKWVLSGLIVFVMAAAAWCGAEWTFRQYVVRAAELKTYDQFVENGVPCRPKYLFIAEEGKTYLKWIAPRSPVAGDLVSGGPVYIFDETGTLVEYTPEHGEGKMLKYDGYDDQKPLSGDFPVKTPAAPAIDVQSDVQSSTENL